MSETTIRITINGSDRIVMQPISITKIVADVSASTQGCAVAINGEVVPKSTWDNVFAQENDRIEILTAAPGG